MIDVSNTDRLTAVPRADPQTNIRLPAALKSKVQQAAEESDRTFTAEVVRRLEASFDGKDPLEALEKRVAELERLLKRGK